MIPQDDLNLEILHEDDHLIFLNKPCMMPSHPDCENLRYFTGTVINFLKHYSPHLCQHTESHRIYKPGLSIGLEKEYSGKINIFFVLTSSNRNFFLIPPN